MSSLDEMAPLGAERSALARAGSAPRAVIPLFGAAAESAAGAARELEPDADPTQPYRARLRLQGLLGRSAALAAVFRRAEPAARFEHLQVLITGPSGSGKTALARVVHENSPRAAGPFVEVNCAAVPRELFEAEFFGCSRNAYTQAAERAGRFAAAAGGTLFLDEVGEIPLAEQAKLLRVLDEGRYERLGEDRSRRADVRVIAATNRDLRAAVAAGRFRADLYFRLNRYEIRMPALEERREDIAELARALAEQQSAALGLPPAQFSGEALRVLEARRWPGNVRELQSAVAQAVIEARAEETPWILPEHCALDANPQGDPVARPPQPAVPGSCECPRPWTGLSYAEATRECQRRILITALERERWNVARTARRLALSRSHLYVLIGEFGLTRPSE